MFYNFNYFSTLIQIQINFRRPRENGFSDNSQDGPPPAKRQQTLPSPTLGPRMSPAGAPSHLPPGLNLRYDEGLYRYDRYDRYDRDLGRPYYSK